MKDICKASSCLAEIARGSVTGYKDVSADIVQTFMSTVTPQRVPIAFVGV